MSSLGDLLTEGEEFSVIHFTLRRRNLEIYLQSRREPRTGRRPWWLNLAQTPLKYRSVAGRPRGDVNLSSEGDDA